MVKRRHRTLKAALMCNTHIPLLDLLPARRWDFAKHSRRAFISHLQGYCSAQLYDCPINSSDPQGHLARYGQDKYGQAKLQGQRIIECFNRQCCQCNQLVRDQCLKHIVKRLMMVSSSYLRTPTGEIKDLGRNGFLDCRVRFTMS